jgi:hypothetical protein
VPAGELRYGVRVVPTEHPEQAVVPEGSVEVMPFNDTTAELVPRTSHGRRAARVRVAVDNRGNLPLTAGLRASDQAQLISFDLRPPVANVATGQAVFVDLRVRPAELIWRGQPRTLPYTVVVDPRDGTSVTLDGTYVQDPVIPRWLPKALLAALVLLLALAALWFGVVRQEVRSAAEAAVQEQVEEAEAKVAEAEAKVAEAEAAAEQAGASAGTAATSAQNAGQALEDVRVLVPAAPTLVETPIAERLRVTTDAGGEDTFTIPADGTLQLTDIVLSNPQGDFGRVVVEVGERQLFDSALENFRDLDYHFVTPIVGGAGEELTMTVQCHTVGVPPGLSPRPVECDTSMLFGGLMLTPPPA